MTHLQVWLNSENREREEKHSPGMQYTWNPPEDGQEYIDPEVCE